MSHPHVVAIVSAAMYFARIYSVRTLLTDYPNVWVLSLCQILLYAVWDSVSLLYEAVGRRMNPIMSADAKLSMPTPPTSGRLWTAGVVAALQGCLVGLENLVLASSTQLTYQGACSLNLAFLELLRWVIQDESYVETRLGSAMIQLIGGVLVLWTSPQHPLWESLVAWRFIVLRLICVTVLRLIPRHLTRFELPRRHWMEALVIHSTAVGVVVLGSLLTPQFAVSSPPKSYLLLCTMLGIFGFSWVGPQPKFSYPKWPRHPGLAFVLHMLFFAFGFLAVLIRHGFQAAQLIGIVCVVCGWAPFLPNIGETARRTHALLVRITAASNFRGCLRGLLSVVPNDSPSWHLWCAHEAFEFGARRRQYGVVEDMLHKKKLRVTEEGRAHKSFLQTAWEVGDHTVLALVLRHSSYLHNERVIGWQTPLVAACREGRAWAAGFLLRMPETDVPMVVAHRTWMGNALQYACGVRGGDEVAVLGHTGIVAIFLRNLRASKRRGVRSRTRRWDRVWRRRILYYPYYRGNRLNVQR